MRSSDLVVERGGDGGNSMRSSDSLMAVVCVDIVGFWMLFFW